MMQSYIHALCSVQIPVTYATDDIAKQYTYTVLCTYAYTAVVNY